MKSTFLIRRVAGLPFALLLYGVMAVGAADDTPAKEKTHLEDLPKRIQFSPGRISLVADFQDKVDGAVMIYLINATTANMDLPSQDGDLYCKRVAKSEDNEWRRCDTHRYSDCGNSYMTRRLPAKEFFAWRQRCDSTQGKERAMRFQLFQGAPLNLESNEGIGKVTEAEINLCRYDGMAMHYASFEDVVTVAMGKVQGGQGSILDGVSCALNELERFPNEKDFLPVLKKIIAKLAAESATNRLGEYNFEACLRGLAKANGHSIDPKECLDFVSSQVQKPNFPWSNIALAWLIRNFAWNAKSIQPLVESVLSQPGHAAMQSAVYGYTELMGKQNAGQRLKAMLEDNAYSGTERNMAREVRERIFVNPYLEIKTEWGQMSETDHRLNPLKFVTVTNISPQEITLPAPSANAVLLVSLVSSEGRLERIELSGGEKSGPIHLKPNEKIELRDFKWWEHMSAEKIRADEKYEVSFEASSPGLWEIPAKTHSSSSIEGARLLAAIRSSKAR